MTYDPSARYEIREWDEVYLEIDGQRLQARIYQPVGAGPFPGIIDVHGGTWTRLDRRSEVYPCRQLAKSGIVVISIDYRLAPAFKYPACLQDTNYAVRWAKLNAGRLSINSELIGGFGPSTGAQMLLLTALRPLDTLMSQIPLSSAEEFDASLAFVLTPDPVFDVTSRYEHLARQPLIVEWIDDSDYPRLRSLPHFQRWFARPRKRLLAGLVEGHELFFSAYEEMADASPLSVLSAGGAQRYPPIFAVQSPADTTLLMESSLAFVSAYLRVGGRIEFNPVSGPGNTNDARVTDMKKFLHGVFLRASENQ